jgi:hypothetical protein
MSWENEREPGPFGGKIYFYPERTGITHRRKVHAAGRPAGVIS